MPEERIGPWTRRTRRLAYENRWITVHHDEVTRPDGGPGEYGVVHFANRAVGIVALTGDDRIVLVGQHRYPLDEYSWEIPEGGVPLAEDPLEGARRELLEETGYRAGHWRALGRFHLSNSVSDEEAIVYLATELEPGRAAPEATEQIEVRLVPLAEALSMADDGRITDALAVIGLQRLALLRTRAAEQLGAGRTAAGNPDTSAPAMR